MTYAIASKISITNVKFLSLIIYYMENDTIHLNWYHHKILDGKEIPAYFIYSP